MPGLIEKAVWLPDLVHVRNVILVLGQLYDRDTWVGGITFTDTGGGFLFIVTFDPDRYTDRGLPFELLFQEAQLRSITLEEACSDGRRYRPWLAGDICVALQRLRLLPGERALRCENVPPLAEIRAERDPPVGLT